MCACDGHIYYVSHIFLKVKICKTTSEAVSMANLLLRSSNLLLRASDLFLLSSNLLNSGILSGKHGDFEGTEKCVEQAFIKT